MDDADAGDHFRGPHGSGERDEIEALEISYPVPIETYDSQVGGGSIVRPFQPAIAVQLRMCISRRW
jgi:hypothetical protein